MSIGCPIFELYDLSRHIIIQKKEKILILLRKFIMWIFGSETEKNALNS